MVNERIDKTAPDDADAIAIGEGLAEAIASIKEQMPSKEEVQELIAQTVDKLQEIHDKIAELPEDERGGAFREVFKQVALSFLGAIIDRFAPEPTNPIVLPEPPEPTPLPAE